MASDEIFPGVIVRIQRRAAAPRRAARRHPPPD
jgi:hypothetical protein